MKRHGCSLRSHEGEGLDGETGVNVELSTGTSCQPRARDGGDLGDVGLAFGLVAVEKEVSDGVLSERWQLGRRRTARPRSGRKSRECPSWHQRRHRRACVSTDSATTVGHAAQHRLGIGDGLVQGLALRALRRSQHVCGERREKMDELTLMWHTFLLVDHLVDRAETKLGRDATQLLGEEVEEVDDGLGAEDSVLVADRRECLICNGSWDRRLLGPPSIPVSYRTLRSD